MKKLAIISVIVPFLIVFQSSCSMVCKKGRGKVVTEIRKITDFDELEINGQASVFIIAGIEPSIEVSIDSNLLEYIKTEVSGNKLKVYESRCIKEIADYKIYITVDNLSKLKIKGATKMSCDSMLQVDNILIETENSGDLSLNFDADKIDLLTKGSGSLNLNGRAANIKIELKGAGSISAFGLYAKNVDFDISGAGTCEISVSEKLTGEVSGSGKFYYKGNPKKVQTNNTGTGIIQTKL